MSKDYILYNDDKHKQIIELLSLQNSTMPVLSVNKKTVENIVGFLKKVKLVTKIVNGSLVIVYIDMLKVKIKLHSNVLNKKIVQQFNVRSSYIATADRNILNRVKTFYYQLNSRSKTNKIIFDASEERNLQRALHMDFSNNDNNNQLVDFQQNEVKDIIKSENKETGYVNIFILCTIIAVLLISISIVIIPKILNL